MAAVFIALGFTTSGVAKIPPEDTADEVPELVEDSPDELIELEIAELVGTELVVADAELILLRDWLFDCTEADSFSSSSSSSSSFSTSFTASATVFIDVTRSVAVSVV